MIFTIILFIIVIILLIFSIRNYLRVKQLNAKLDDLYYHINEKKKRILEISVCSIPCNKCKNKDICFDAHYSINAFTCNKISVYFMKELKKWQERQIDNESKK